MRVVFYVILYTTSPLEIKINVYKKVYKNETFKNELIAVTHSLKTYSNRIFITSENIFKLTNKSDYQFE
jgi:hypothetical protein